MENDTNIYTFYKGYSSDLIDCVYTVSPKVIRQLFAKKLGISLRKKTFVSFSKEEEIPLQKSYIWFEKYLKMARQLQINGYSLKQIAAYIKKV